MFHINKINLHILIPKILLILLTCVYHGATADTFFFHIEYYMPQALHLLQKI